MSLFDTIKIGCYIGLGILGARIFARWGPWFEIAGFVVGFAFGMFLWWCLAHFVLNRSKK